MGNNNLKFAFKEIKNIRSLCGASMLAALNIVLNYTTVFINSTLRVGFSSITVALSAMLFGPWLAGFMGMGMDIIKYLLRPDGPYFAGFALNEFIIAAIYGCLLYRKKFNLNRVIIARTLHTVIINLILTPLWLDIIYSLPFMASFIPRLVKNILMLPLDIFILYMFLKVVVKISANVPFLKERIVG